MDRNIEFIAAFTATMITDVALTCRYIHTAPRFDLDDLDAKALMRLLIQRERRRRP